MEKVPPEELHLKVHIITKVQKRSGGSERNTAHCRHPITHDLKNKGYNTSKPVHNKAN